MLFAWAFAAATILPVASEVALAVEVMRRGNWQVPVVVATIGNVLGAATTYALARFAVTRAPVPSPRLARASALLARYGAPALLLSWVPVIGDALCVASGWLRQNAIAATLFMALGKFARYYALAAGLAWWRL